MTRTTMSFETEARRLAAIVAADMVGYSRLMEIDEAGTLARQKAIQTELINPKVNEFGGRVVKTTGDGALIEFTSAVNAVLCAVAVQREMAAREADVPQERRIAYRIGINLGDIIHDGDDIFGDGVNVASRLEGLAEPGGIRISEAVFNNVRGKLDLGFADLGRQKVKNLSEPIPTYQVLLEPGAAGKIVRPTLKRFPLAGKWAIALSAALLIAVSGHFAWDRFSPGDTGEQKLLVLPFAAENAASRQIADVATENLIASFSRLKGLAIVSHAVSMEYKGIALALDEVPEELGVRYILDGSAKLANGRIEVSARLRDRLKSGDGVVWEQTQDGQAEQLFDLLATLKQKATGEMKVKLNPTERAILETRPTENVDAYLAFVEADRLLHSGDFTDFEDALPLFEKAVNLDPDFIEAQQGHAEINFLIWSRSFNTIRYTLDALKVAEETIDKLLSTDPSNPWAIGLEIRIAIERLNRDQALTLARAAVFKQPDTPWLRNVLGLALMASGRYEDAKAEFAAYERLSPRLNSEEKRNLAWQYLRLGDEQKALSLLTSIPKEEAEIGLQYRLLANAQVLSGDIEMAKANIAKFLKVAPWLNLMWRRPSFDIYSDPSLYEDYAAAMAKAGLPEWPYNFDKGREDDRLLHDELMELFSDAYREVTSKDPFGAPYKEIRKADGTISMHFAWMNGIAITGKWYIKEDQLCHRLPAVHMGREDCNIIYIDREKSTGSVKHITILGSFGPFKSEFRRVDD